MAEPQLTHAASAQPAIKLSPGRSVYPAAGETRLQRDERSPETLQELRLKRTHLCHGHMVRDASAGGGGFPRRGAGEVQQRWWSGVEWSGGAAAAAAAAGCGGLAGAGTSRVIKPVVAA